MPGMDLDPSGLQHNMQPGEQGFPYQTFITPIFNSVIDFCIDFM